MTLAGIELNHDSPLPLYRQLYDAIRDAILEERLQSGHRLPASRMFAKELGVSRNTVALAFEQLMIEGYLKGKVGSGTYVTDDLPERLLQTRPSVDDRTAASSKRHRASRRGRTLSKIILRRNRTPEDVRPFQAGVPAMDEFPYAFWLKLTQQVWRSLPRNHLAYGGAGGYEPLREAIASYLRTSRAVRCDADQVVIVNGSQQGVDLVARVLLDSGDQVFVEDPGYLGARAALLGAGVRLMPTPVDAEGLQIENRKARSSQARLVYVTPSHQYPLGVTMTLARRLHLLEWARRSGAWILEDDYDSEFRYAGRPLASLQGLDTCGCVIYLGTFSKVLFPGLRLGYLVVPKNVVDEFLSAKTIADRQSAILEQAVLARFIEEGHFARHLRRMRVLYQHRQEILLDVAAHELGGLLEIHPSDSGMHLIAWLQKEKNAQEIARRAEEFGVIAHPLSDYTMRYHQRPALLLGYAAYDDIEIRQGVRRLAQAITSSRKAKNYGKMIS